MKKLGLVGGIGPESTIPYYRQIVYGVQDKIGKKMFPPLTIESVDVFYSLDLCARRQKDEYIQYFSKAINNLAKAGADFAAISANTPHMYFAELQQLASVPLVSIVETACEEAVRRGYQRLALLGTSFTMRSDFYQQVFSEQDITLVTPEAAEIDYIEQKISDELELGIKNPQTLQVLQQIIGRMQREEAVEAVILGCTELPLLLNDDVTPVPCLDTMQVHINKLIEMIVEGE